MINFIKKHKILCAVIAFLILCACLKSPVLIWFVLGAIIVSFMSGSDLSFTRKEFLEPEKNSSSHIRDSVYCNNRCIYCGKEFYAPPNVVCESCARKRKFKTNTEEEVLKQRAEHDVRVFTVLRSAADYNVWIKAYTVVRHSQYLLALDEMDRKGQKLPGTSYEDDYRAEPAYLRRHLTQNEYVQYRQILEYNTPKTSKELLEHMQRQNSRLGKESQRERERRDLDAALDRSHREFATERRYEDTKFDLNRLSYDLDAKGMHDAAFYVKNLALDMDKRSFSQISYSQMKDKLENISLELDRSGYYDAAQEVRARMFSLDSDDFLR